EDAAGQKSDFTLPYSFNYDGTAPNKPGLPNIIDGIGDSQGKVAQGSTIDDARPVMTGQAESGDSVVEIFDAGQSIGFATVNADGSWSYTLNLKQGSHSITVQETDKAGNKSVKSDALNFTVDTSKVNLTVDYLEDNFGNADGKTVQISNGGLTNDKTPVLVGTATPGSVIEILEGGIPLSVANPPVADATGRWTFSIPTNFLTDGTHTYQIKTTSKSGNITETQFSVTVDTSAPDSGKIESIEDTVPPSLGFL
ncbi:Ig-like domain-containing protein, partial [Thorsellia kenyensis]